MNKLETELSCEVDDMIRCIARDTGKDYAVVELAMFKEYLYPESNKTFVTTKFGKQDAENSWLRASIYRILDENGIESINITNPI
jgi:hypothetical protein